jgi:small subunit ribosomal protein S6
MAQTVNTYELTYIVNGVLSDNQTKEVVSRITRYIEEHGGTILEVDEWGTRRLAYPLRKKRNGYYVNMYFQAPGDIIIRLERTLEIDEDILRYLTLRFDAKMMRHYEQQKSNAKRARAQEIGALGGVFEEEEEES